MVRILTNIGNTERNWIFKHSIYGVTEPKKVKEYYLKTFSFVLNDKNEQADSVKYFKKALEGVIFK